MLTRARMAVSATFALKGGGVKMTTAPNAKLRGIGRRRKKCSEALNEYFRKYNSYFYAKVNVEVTSGHQRSKFSGASHFFENFLR